MSKKLLALLLAMIMVIGSFTSVLADTTPKADEKKATEVKPEDKKDEAKPEEKKDEAKPEEKTEEKKEEKKEEPAKDEALERAMDVLKKAAVIEGFKAGEEDFKAEKNVTRAEFAAMIVRANNLKLAAEAAKATPTGFIDVPVTHWANGYIAIAKNQMYVNGYPTGKFLPEGQITYQEMAKMLVCALGKGEVGDTWPTSYIVKAQSLGLLNGVTAPVFTEKATRGDVFKMLYNMMTSKEFGKRKILKAIVLENSRVEKLADDEVTVEVIDIVQKADWVEKSRTTDKKGDQHTYKLDKDLMLDAENLLGKVVDITVDQNDKIVEVKVDKTYDYLEGKITNVRTKKFELDEKEYTASFDERYDRADERIFRTYLNNKDYTYLDFAKDYEKKSYDFARVTVKNGKVIFIDAYQFDDIAPVSNTKDGNVYYLDDNWSANEVKASKLNDRVVFKDKAGYSVGDIKNIAKDDVIHFYNGYEDAIVRKDAKVEAKLDKTVTRKFRDNGVTKVNNFAVLGKDEYLLRPETYFQAIYSFEGKKFFVVKEGNRGLLKSIEKGNVKVLVALDGSAQLIEGTKEWTDGIQAIKKITSRGEVNFLPVAGDAFWAGETRDTKYYSAARSNNARLLDFSLEDIVYLARGEKEEEISKMGEILSHFEYSNWKKAQITDRYISFNVNTPKYYRYYTGLRAYSYDKEKGLRQIPDLYEFYKNNKKNTDLKAYVLSEGELKARLDEKNGKTTYNFLSEDSNVAGLVVFAGAVDPDPDTEKRYAEVVKTYSDGFVDYLDENAVPFTAKTSGIKENGVEVGDIVKLAIDKATLKADVIEAEVLGNKIKYNAPVYRIEISEKEPNTYLIYNKNSATPLKVRWDGKQHVFNKRGTLYVQYRTDSKNVDAAGNYFMEVMRYKDYTDSTAYRTTLKVAPTTANILVYNDGVDVSRVMDAFTMLSYRNHNNGPKSILAIGGPAVKAYLDTNSAAYNGAEALVIMDTMRNTVAEIVVTRTNTDIKSDDQAYLDAAVASIEKAGALDTDKLDLSMLPKELKGANDAETKANVEAKVTELVKALLGARYNEVKVTVTATVTAGTENGTVKIELEKGLATPKVYNSVNFHCTTAADETTAKDKATNKEVADRLDAKLAGTTPIVESAAARDKAIADGTAADEVAYIENLIKEKIMDAGEAPAGTTITVASPITQSVTGVYEAKVTVTTNGTATTPKTYLFSVTLAQ